MERIQEWFNQATFEQLENVFQIYIGKCQNKLTIQFNLIENHSLTCYNEKNAILAEHYDIGSDNYNFHREKLEQILRRRGEILRNRYAELYNNRVTRFTNYYNDLLISRSFR